ncbi:arylesterase [Chitinilyticum piscinae]|uniref:Arylesterase n=1 Tax=Chitinilyticum piscinae TaxID=2866724 RepID=A0A8J7FQA0_9NEIS|nr:arylesterase [Chitinilyticum piscinae]MBE9610289.1 arylesterase [Chitinilyticum piscinae]
MVGKFWAKLLGSVLLILPLAGWAAAPKALVLGDSLSAGYGLPASQAWPALWQLALQQSGSPWQVINASVSGETTAGGVTRFPALLKQHAPALVIIELGANDGLRGLPVRDMRMNLTRLVQQARAAGARVHLVGMRIPPNYGPEYTSEFEQAFVGLAREQKLSFTPFLLAPLGDDRRLFQADQLHPTAAGQARIADQMGRELRPVLAGFRP